MRTENRRVEERDLVRERGQNGKRMLEKTIRGDQTLFDRSANLRNNMSGTKGIVIARGDAGGARKKTPSSE